MKTNVSGKESLFFFSVIFLLFLLLLSAFSQAVSAYPEKLSTAKENAKKFAKADEAVLIEGPFYVNNREYYVFDFATLGKTRASLVYDAESRDFVKDKEIYRKTLATRDLALLTIFDPLFYAAGNAEKLIIASRFETQNVRNFAEFSKLFPYEREGLETLLFDYESIMRNVAKASEKTNEILYPGNALEISYNPEKLAIDVSLSEPERKFSYESFAELVDSYSAVYESYKNFVNDLKLFAGELPEYFPGETIREKWNVTVTKESILREVELVEANQNRLKDEVELRKNILNHAYDEEYRKAMLRLGINIEEKEKNEGSFFAFLRRIFEKIKEKLSSIFSIPSANSAEEREMLLNPPTMEELVSKKVKNASAINYTIEAEGIDKEKAEEIIKGYPLLLEGEKVVIKGPYYYYGEPNYLVYIYKEGSPTSYGFLVDAENYRLIGSQRRAFQVMKAIMVANLLREKPLYNAFSDSDIAEIESHAKNEKAPLALFLENLTSSLRNGKALENELIEKPDFATLMELVKEMKKTYIALANIGKSVSDERANKITRGAYNKIYLFDAYFIASKGLSADEFLSGRIAQYRTRTLNRIPLIITISAMGLGPGKAQIINDITSDLIYDNIYIYHLGDPRDKAVFARLAFKEGTFILPESVPEELLNVTKQK